MNYSIFLKTLSWLRSDSTMVMVSRCNDGVVAEVEMETLMVSDTVSRAHGHIMVTPIPSSWARLHRGQCQQRIYYFADFLLDRSTSASFRSNSISSWTLGENNKVYGSPQGYSKEILNIFTSAFEIKEQLFVLTILIDEPKGSKTLWGHNRRESGWNAGYISGQIIKKIGPILNTMRVL